MTMVQKFLDEKLKKTKDFELAFEEAQEFLGNAEEKGNPKEIRYWERICQEIQLTLEEIEIYGHPFYE